MDAAWLSWIDDLIRLTGEGRLPPVARRPLPTAGGGPLGFPSQRGEILLGERSSPAEETRRKFDADFREGAVRLVRETGKPIAQVAQELGINEGTPGTGSMLTGAAGTARAAA